MAHEVTEARMHRPARFMGWADGAETAATLAGVGQAKLEDFTVFNAPEGTQTLVSSLHRVALQPPHRDLPAPSRGLLCFASCDAVVAPGDQGLVPYNDAAAMGALIQDHSGFRVTVRGRSWPVFACCSRAVPPSKPQSESGGVSVDGAPSDGGPALRRRISDDMFFAWTDDGATGRLLLTRDVTRVPCSTCPFSEALLLHDSMLPRAAWTRCAETPLLVGVPRVVVQGQLPQHPPKQLPYGQRGHRTVEQEALQQAVQCLLETFAANVPSALAETINALLDTLFTAAVPVSVPTGAPVSTGAPVFTGTPAPTGAPEPSLEHLTARQAQQLIDLTCHVDLVDAALRLLLEARVDRQ